MLLAAPLAGAQSLYCSVTTNSYGKVQPSASDRECDYDADSQTYTITLEDFAMKVPVGGKDTFQYIRFYLKDADGKVTPWNVPSSSNVKFGVGPALVQTYEIERDANSPLYVSRFANDLESATISFTIRLDVTYDAEHDMHLGSLAMEQMDEGPAPEVIYLWGSTDGGRDTSVRAQMLPSESNPKLYEVEYDVKRVSYNPEDSFGGDMAFSFFLGTNGESYKLGTIFLAYYPAYGDTPEPQYRTINLTPGQTFTTTLRATTLDASNLMCYSPGKMKMTFDLTTLEFTCTMLSGAASVDEVPVDESDDAVYYDLQGRRVVNPDRGLYIRVVSGHATKIAK